MRRAGVAACVPLLFLLGVAASGQPEEPFRPKGAYNNSVHRFHPDLDARLNTVRFTRWHTLEIAWVSGLTEQLDKEISTYAANLLKRPSRFPPEADRVAPLLARDALSIFRVLRWGETLENQLLDVLASSDAEKALSAARLERALLLYRRERWALPEPAEPSPGESSGTTAVWRIEMSGMRLVVRAAADLTIPDFAQQRWRVTQTIADFDQTIEAEHPAGELAYASGAPGVAEDFSGIARALDRIEQFRLEVLGALAPAGATREARRQREELLRAVAQRYGLPATGIGEARSP